MLPETFSDTGVYSDRDYDCTRGFTLLAHAEIEGYIEELVLATIDGALKGWQTDRKPRACLLSLMAYHDPGFGGTPKSIGVSKKKKKNRDLLLRERLAKAKREYATHVIKDNHGIREEHILRMLLPVGLIESDLPGPWIDKLNSFGDDRGAMAHTCTVTNHPDPKQAWDDVKLILEGLESIDALLTQLAG